MAPTGNRQPRVQDPISKRAYRIIARRTRAQEGGERSGNREGGRGAITCKNQANNDRSEMENEESVGLQEQKASTRDC